MTKARTGASYVIVVTAALLTRKAVSAYQQRHRRIGGASPDNWSVAVQPPPEGPGRTG